MENRIFTERALLAQGVSEDKIRQVMDKLVSQMFHKGWRLEKDFSPKGVGRILIFTQNHNN